MKKFVLWLVIALLCFSLCACVNDSKDTNVHKEDGYTTGIKPTIEQTQPSSTIKKEPPIVIVAQKAAGTRSGFSFAEFTVQNNTSDKIHALTLNIKILDKNGVIISTTHPQDPVVLSPGESIIISALCEEGAYAMVLDGYNFYTGTDFSGDYISGHFESADKLILE